MSNENSTRMDLRQFIDRLEAKGELHRITVEVDPRLEIAAITDRVSKGAGGGRALVFERVRGHRFPVATNLFGSLRRVAMALGHCSIDPVLRTLQKELAAAAGSGAHRLASILARGEFAPELVDTAPWREETAASGGLFQLPALQSWPEDAGRFLTLPQVFTIDPETGERNCGMYRMQVFDDSSAGIRWRPGSDAARHHAAWQRQGRRMPVAVALGGDPVLTYAACAPLPAGIDEISYAGLLRGRSLRMTECLGGALSVPVSAEFVLEGYVDPAEERLEGPFGNHTGSYGPSAPCPVFHLTKMYHRRRAIYPCTLVGPPPMENCWLAKVHERLLLPVLRCDFPQVIDINFPMETIFHGCVMLSVREATAGRDLLQELWQSRYFRSSRLLVLVGEDMDVQNAAGVYWTVINRIDPEQDVIFNAGRVGIDATRPRVGAKVQVDAKTAMMVERRWQEYGFACDTDMCGKGESA